MKSFKFTIRGNDYDVEISSFEDNVARIEVNGTKYKVEVQRQSTVSKTPVLVRSEPSVPRSAHKIKKNISSGTQLKAPLPGNIMQVFVKEGDVVKKGDKLLMYEAMKMENMLTAEKDGTVQKVLVAPGDSILQGALLMEIV